MPGKHKSYSHKIKQDKAIKRMNGKKNKFSGALSGKY